LLQFGTLCLIAARSGGGCIHFDIGWRGRWWRHPPLITLAALLADADVVFRELVVSFGGNAILTSRRVTRQREVALGYLRGGSAGALAGPPTVE
jgi:hypothetical protein